jgi:uncharacterized protein
MRVTFIAYGVFGLLALFWLAVVGYLYANQRRMLFQPDRERVAPSQARLTGVTEEVISTPDGERLIAWWSPPKPGKPTILYFHGNGGNLAGRAGRLQLFQEAGYGGLMLADRGYSGSTGEPSETALIADAKLAFDRLVARGIAAEQIILFGESLGSGLAVQVAANRPARALILDSPYTSIVEIAAARIPWVPVRWLMADPFDSMAHIGKVRAPMLVIHGDRDDIVPYALGKKLFDAAHEPKRLLTLKGAGHVTPLRDVPWSTVKGFIEGLGR